MRWELKAITDEALNSRSPILTSVTTWPLWGKLVRRRSHYIWYCFFTSSRDILAKFAKSSSCFQARTFWARPSGCVISLPKNWRSEKDHFPWQRNVLMKKGPPRKVQLQYHAYTYIQHQLTHRLLCTIFCSENRLSKIQNKRSEGESQKSGLDLIWRIHKECGFYGVMMRFLDLLQKTQNSVLDFPEKPHHLSWPTLSAYFSSLQVIITNSWFQSERVCLNEIHKSLWKLVSELITLELSSCSRAQREIWLILNRSNYWWNLFAMHAIMETEVKDNTD